MARDIAGHQVDERAALGSTNAEAPKHRERRRDVKRRVSITAESIRVEVERPHTEADWMARVTLFNSVTLDGVMQAPGHPDEDRRGGFEHGGWATPYFDHTMGAVAGQGMAATSGILLGRRTYENFYGYWPQQTDNPFTDVLNNTQKYVASRTMAEPLPWMNSTLLRGDAADAVAELKRDTDGELVILGSGELARSLMRRNLIDAYTLLIHPLVLGSGMRLFPDDWVSRFRLVRTTPTTTGVVIATYEPTEQ
jgi:dihydrofolate reductase